MDATERRAALRRIHDMMDGPDYLYSADIYPTASIQSAVDEEWLQQHCQLTLPSHDLPLRLRQIGLDEHTTEQLARLFQSSLTALRTRLSTIIASRAKLLTAPPPELATVLRSPHDLVKEWIRSSQHMLNSRVSEMLEAGVGLAVDYQRDAQYDAFGDDSDEDGKVVIRGEEDSDDDHNVSFNTKAYHHIFEHIFQRGIQKPSRHDKMAYSAATGIPVRSITIWFQNRRHRGPYGGRTDWKKKKEEREREFAMTQAQIEVVTQELEALGPSSDEEIGAGAWEDDNGEEDDANKDFPYAMPRRSRVPSLSHSIRTADESEQSYGPLSGAGFDRAPTPRSLYSEPFSRSSSPQIIQPVADSIIHSKRFPRSSGARATSSRSSTSHSPLVDNNGLLLLEFPCLDAPTQLGSSLSNDEGEKTISNTLITAQVPSPLHVAPHSPTPHPLAPSFAFGSTSSEPPKATGFSFGLPTTPPPAALSSATSFTFNPSPATSLSPPFTSPATPAANSLEPSLSKTPQLSFGASIPSRPFSFGQPSTPVFSSRSASLSESPEGIVRIAAPSSAALSVSPKAFDFSNPRASVDFSKSTPTAFTFGVSNSGARRSSGSPTLSGSDGAQLQDVTPRPSVFNFSKPVATAEARPGPQDASTSTPSKFGAPVAVPKTPIISFNATTSATSPSPLVSFQGTVMNRDAKGKTKAKVSLAPPARRPVAQASPSATSAAPTTTSMFASTFSFSPIAKIPFPLYSSPSPAALTSTSPKSSFDFGPRAPPHALFRSQTSSSESVSQVDPDVRNAATALEILAASAASAMPVLPTSVVEPDADDVSVLSDDEIGIVPISMPAEPTKLSFTPAVRAPTLAAVELIRDEASRAASIPLPPSPDITTTFGTAYSAASVEEVEDDEPLMANTLL